MCVDFPELVSSNLAQPIPGSLYEKRRAFRVCRLAKPADLRPLPVGEIEEQMADDAELCDLTRDVHQELPARARVTIEDGALTGCQGIVLACNGLVTTLDVEVFGRRRLTRVARSMVVLVNRSRPAACFRDLVRHGSLEKINDLCFLLRFAF